MSPTVIGIVAAVALVVSLVAAAGLHLAGDRKRAKAAGKQEAKVREARDEEGRLREALKRLKGRLPDKWRMRQGPW